MREFGFPLTIVAIILYSGYKQKWVWGWQYREIKNERDFWRATAMVSTAVSEVAVKKVAKEMRDLEHEGEQG
jgi:hypothetical protein